MQSHNVNVLTKSLKFKRLDVKLQNSQNSNKFLMFCVKSQRRKHCNSEIIHVILNWIAKSIDSDDFLAEVMRRLCVCVCNVCVCVMIDVINQEHFSKIGRIFQSIKALIETLFLSNLWDIRSCSRADLQPVHASNDFWTEHEHIDLRLPESSEAWLKNIFKFTIIWLKFNLKYFICN